MLFPIEALIAEAKQELRKRYEVYPRLVARSSLSQQRMDQLIALQHAIVENLEAQRHAGQLDMFGARQDDVSPST